MDALYRLPDVATRTSRFQRLGRAVQKHKGLLLLMLPGVVWFIAYHYIPIYGITLAFKRFRIMEGVLGSPWVGLEYFERLFASAKFYRVFVNTIVLALMRLVFYMPVPILFALLLNELRHLGFRKIVQTVSYLPHFLSWVVIAGIFRNLLSPTNGIVNYVFGLFGRVPVPFMLQSQYFRGIIILSSIWTQTGWGSIVILAAILGIDPALYDACSVDGGGRWTKLWRITLPGILPVVLMLYVLRIGRLLRSGFDQVINFYNPAVFDVGDIINTYVYRVGLQHFDYSYATAIGLFANLISFALLMLSNWGVRKIDPRSALW